MLFEILNVVHELFCKYSVLDNRPPIMFLISTMVYSVVGGCVKWLFQRTQVPAHEDWLGVLVGTSCKFGTAVAEIF